MKWSRNSLKVEIIFNRVFEDGGLTSIQLLYTNLLEQFQDARVEIVDGRQEPSGDNRFYVINICRRFLEEFRLSVIPEEDQRSIVDWNKRLVNPRVITPQLKYWPFLANNLMTKLGFTGVNLNTFRGFWDSPNMRSMIENFDTYAQERASVQLHFVYSWVDPADGLGAAIDDMNARVKNTNWALDNAAYNGVSSYHQNKRNPWNRQNTVWVDDQMAHGNWNSLKAVIANVGVEQEDDIFSDMSDQGEELQRVEVELEAREARGEGEPALRQQQETRIFEDVEMVTVKDPKEDSYYFPLLAVVAGVAGLVLVNR